MLQYLIFQEIKIGNETATSFSLLALRPMPFIPFYAVIPEIFRNFVRNIVPARRLGREQLNTDIINLYKPTDCDESIE